MDILYKCYQAKKILTIRKKKEKWIHNEQELNKTLSRCCGVMVVVYKNITQSSNTACIPELQLASPITQSTSTACEGNTTEITNYSFHTDLHDARRQQVNVLVLGTLSVRPYQTLMAFMKQRLGYQTLTNTHFY